MYTSHLLKPKYISFILKECYQDNPQKMIHENIVLLMINSYIYTFLIFKNEWPNNSIRCHCTFNSVVVSGVIHYICFQSSCNTFSYSQICANETHLMSKENQPWSDNHSPCLNVCCKTLPFCIIAFLDKLNFVRIEL